MSRLGVDEWFRRAGVSPQMARERGNAEAIKRLGEAGLGIGITSAVTVKAEVRAGRLVALPLAPRLTRELVVVRRRDKAVNPALQALLAALDPRWIIITGILFGALEAGASALQRNANVPATLASVIEASIVLAVIAIGQLRTTWKHNNT